MGDLVPIRCDHANNDSGLLLICHLFVSLSIAVCVMPVVLSYSPGGSPITQPSSPATNRLRASSMISTV